MSEDFDWAAWANKPPSLLDRVADMNGGRGTLAHLPVGDGCACVLLLVVGGIGAAGIGAAHAIRHPCRAARSLAAEGRRLKAAVARLEWPSNPRC